MAGSDDTKKVLVSAELPARSWPHLVVLAGPDIGRAYRISQDETVIGRSVDAGVMLLSKTVSRRHALVRLVGDRLAIEDLGSRNGTFVGIDKIKGQVELADGDEITVGDTVLLQLRYSVALEGVMHGAGYETASRDPLTGLASTPHLLDRLRAEYAFARRHRQPLAIVYLRASDRPRVAAVGAADDVLQAFARVLRKEARAEDLVARTAENELMVLLRANAREAELMIERIRSTVTGELPKSPAHPPINIVIVPLAARTVASPSAVVAAVRAEAMHAIGGERYCMVVVPAFEVVRAADDESD